MRHAYWTGGLAIRPRLAYNQQLIMYFVFFLALYWQKESQELDDYQALIESGILYEAIQGSEKKKKKNSKVTFQKWLNGEGWHYQVINNWFEQEFTELFLIIRGWKKHDQYTPFHLHLRRLEAKIVIRTVGAFRQNQPSRSTDY